MTTCIAYKRQVQTLPNLAQRLGGNLKNHVPSACIDKLIINLVLVIDPQIGAELSRGRNGRRWARGFEGGSYRYSGRRSRGRGGALHWRRTFRACDLQDHLGWGDAHVHSPI